MQLWGDFVNMPEMIQGVTLRENLPETVPASQSTLEQLDYAEDGCEYGDLSFDEEDHVAEVPERLIVQTA